MEEQPVPIATPVHPPTAPPVARALADAGSTSRWATAVGTIAIVFGCLSAIGGIMAIVSPLFNNMIAPMPGNPAFEAIQQTTRSWLPWTIAASVAVLIISALLLIGAARLLKRRSSCRGVLLTYAVIAVCQSIAGTTVGYFVQRDMTAAIAGIQGSGPLTASFGSTMSMIGMTFGLIWNLAVPVFLLIWFNRDKIKQEVAGWSTIVPQARPA